MKKLYTPASHFQYIFLILLCSSQVTRGQINNKVITHSGQEAPGTNGALFDRFEPLSIDNLPDPLGDDFDGSVLFHAWLQSGTGDVTAENNEGIWLHKFDKTKLIARKGGAVPGIPGKFFLNDRTPRAYYTAFRVGLDAEYSDTGNNEGAPTHSFFIENDNDSLEILITPGMEVLPGVFLTTNFQVYAFNGGAVLFSTGLSGTGVNSSNNSAICLIEQASNKIEVLARAGDSMEGVTGGFNYHQYFSYNGTNPLNKFRNAFYNISGTRGPPTEGIGAVYRWWSDSGNSLFNVSEIDNTLTVFGEYRLNDNPGDVAGLGFSVWPTTKKIWFTDLIFDDAKTIVTEGDATPGLDGNLFNDFIDFVLFDNRSVGFLAATDQGNSGIWISDSTGLHKVAAIGDHAPGLPEGYNFFRVNHMIANPIGQVAFSDLAVAASDETNGLWMGNHQGLLLLTQRGDTVELSDGELKTIEDIFLSNAYGGTSRTGRDGHPSNFNAEGELVFSVTLTGGGNALMLAKPGGLIVNSMGDAEDNDLFDGICDTGGPIIEGRPECTLRAAIQEANNKNGRDKITFDIPTASEDEPATILLQSDLPKITGSVAIDGTTQKQGRVEVSAELVFIGFDLEASDNVIKGLVINEMSIGIAIDGGSGNIISDNYIGTSFNGKEAKGNSTGVVITGSTKNNLIENNVISGNFDGGIFIDDAPKIFLNLNNTIRNNFIGTDKDGLNAIANGDAGIFIRGHVGSTIQDNIISGNDGHGIEIVGDTTGVIIEGNFIGTDSTGNQALANKGAGIVISQSSNNLINGNLISGNTGDGIHIEGFSEENSDFIPPDVPLSRNNKIIDNKIGPNFTNNFKDYMGNQNGITIDSSANNVIEENQITGNTFAGINMIHANENTIDENFAGTRFYLGVAPNDQIHGVYMINCNHNEIVDNYMWNNSYGVFILDGESNNLVNNVIGGSRNGIVVEGKQFNKITKNGIFDIRKEGIDLGFDGVTLNDEKDLDEGSNGLQNFPELTKVELLDDAIVIIGNISGEPNNQDVVMEFFNNKYPGANGHGPGRIYLGTHPVFFDNEGNYEFEVVIPFSGIAFLNFLKPGRYVTATARNSNGNTSEFSNYVKIELPDFDADLWVAVTDSVLKKTTTSSEFEYTIQYGNNGPDNAIGVSLSNLLPEFASYTVDPEAEPDSTIAYLGNLRNYSLQYLAPGESGELIINAMADTTSGNFINITTISSASADSSPSNNADTVITDLDKILITGLIQIPSPFPDKYILEQNYPNPFSKRTTIQYSIPEKTIINIAVYDAFGKKVGTLLNNSIIPAGNYELEFFAENLNPGLYYYTIEAGEYHGVKKMILIK